MSAGPSLHQLETLDAAQEPPADPRDDRRFPSAHLILSNCMHTQQDVSLFISSSF